MSNCKFCGDPFEADRKNHKYCSKDSCKIKYYESIKERFADKTYPIVCKICNKNYNTKNYRRHVCDDPSCISAFEKQLVELANSKVRTKNCVVCKSPFETKIAKENCCSDSCREVFYSNRTKKTQATNISTWGVDHPNKSPIIREKTIKTNLERCGYENVSYDPKIKQKISDIHHSKTEEQKEEIKQKRINTCLEKYNVEYTLQLESLKVKNKEFWMKNYGVDCANKCKHIRDKIGKTNIERYGVEYTFQNEDVKQKSKETWILNYGDDNPSKSKIIKQRKVDTCRENWGADNPMQNEEIFLKQQKNSYNWKSYILPSGKEVFIQGYEGIYLNEYFAGGGLEEDIIIHPHQTDIGKIKFFFDGKKCRYYPDFYLPKENKIIEVKSDYFLLKFIDLNVMKQFVCESLGFKFEFKVYYHS